MINIKVKKNKHSKADSNDGNPNWIIFDYTLQIATVLFIRVALSKELWYQTLQKNGSKLFKIFSIDIEQDAKDPSLKLYNLTIFGFLINVGWI